MTDLLLAFATDYGLYVVASVVFLAALGIPLPASVIVLTSGGLSATGDILLIELFVWTLTAYVLGDQSTYQIGKMVGPNILDKLSGHKRLAPVVTKSERFYEKYGLLAILMSRTIISPCGPYVAYISGAWEMDRLRYTLTALAGAAIWTSVYIALGYTFAGNVPEISDLMASIMLVSLAILFTLGFGFKLAMCWRDFKSQLAS
ncbi:DedA family protein [Leucothrix sargassi]|nr:DedA family protein [Leucothrix sargassi]